MNVPLRADREFLRTVAYATPEGLTARTALYDYQRPKLDIVAAVVDAAGHLHGRCVADVGCGPGAYLSTLTDRGAWVVGIDLSAGMLPNPVTGRPVTVADAAALPLTAGCLDVALACHMLYHLPDPQHALDEFRRVLRPGGRLVAAVAGPGHLAEIQALWAPLLAHTGLDTTDPDLALLNDRLPAEVLGELLGDQFVAVRRSDLSATIVIDDPAPVLRHAASTAGGRTARRAEPAIFDRLNDQLAARIASNGEFRITTSVSIFSSDRP